MFNIRAVKVSPIKIDGVMHQKGQINLGDWSESFMMPLNYWSLQQYQKQWNEAIKRLKTHDSSCLITVIEELPNKKMLASMWVLYKVSDKVYFQWHFFPNEDPSLENLPPIDEKTCYQYIRPRFSELGSQAEEWVLPLKDVFSYLRGK